MPSPEIPKVAIESKKHAASLPKPPFPNDGSNSISSISHMFFPFLDNISFTSSYIPKFIRLLDSNFPIKNSADI